MLYAITLFIAFSFLSYRLIGSYESKSKAFISSVFSLVFSSALYYTFHLKYQPKQGHFIQFDHYTFLYFITLIIVSMGFALILEMVTDSSKVVRKDTPKNPFTWIKDFFKTRIRYLHLLRIVSQKGLFKSTLEMNREKRNTQMARALRETLEEAGGVFVKFGQFLSTRTDLFSAEFIEEMVKLQENVHKLPGEVIEASIEQQLGQKVTEVFKTFTIEPIAAASIAQVHRATLPTGEQVVVKVLRPELKKQMAVDVTILHNFASLLEERMPWGEDIGIVSIADGFIENLYEETDLSIERTNIQQMRAGRSEKVYIPKVYPEYSTSELLVVEYVRGNSLTKAQGLTSAACDQLADDLYEEMLEQIFDRGVFHGDPHPGNIFIMPNGKPAFLDFGAVGRLSKIQRKGFTWLLLGIIRKNPESMAMGVELLVENSQQLDLGKLEQALSQFLVNHSFEGDILEEMGADLFAMMGQFGLRFHPSVAVAFRSLITLQGSLQKLSPTFSLAKVMEIFVRNQLTVKKAAEVISTGVEEDLFNLIPKVRAFPKRMDNVLRQLESGDFTFNMGIFSHKENLKYVNKTMSLLFLSIVGFAFGLLALGALFLAQSEVTEGYSFLNVFGYAGLGLSVVMLIRVAIQSIQRAR